MKAKRLRDGKIVEVEKHGDAMIDGNGKVLYFDEICEVDEPDWNQARIQAAIAAMHAELSNPNNEFMACEDKCGIIVQRAVRYANALTNELKK